MEMIIEILKIVVALIGVISFFALAGIGFSFFWLILWTFCGKILHQVIGIEFWILMVSLIILSDQLQAPFFIPFFKVTVPHIPYWIHIVTVAAGFGLVIAILLIPGLIALRIKYGKHASFVFNVKV